MAPPMPCSRTAQNNAGDRAAGCGQWGKALPAVRPDFVYETLVMRPAVLLDEPSNGVQPTVQDGNTDVIRTARQRCGCRPAIAGRIVDVVIWPVDVLLRVPTDQVQAARMCCGPGHFATGQGSGAFVIQRPGLAALGAGLSNTCCAAAASGLSIRPGCAVFHTGRRDDLSPTGRTPRPGEGGRTHSPGTPVGYSAYGYFHLGLAPKRASRLWE